MKCRKPFFPSRASWLVRTLFQRTTLTHTISLQSPLPLRKDNNSSNFTGTEPHFVCSKSRFFSPGPSPVNDPCANPRTKERTRSKIFFFGQPPQPRLDRPDAASEPYAPCKFGLTLDRFHNPYAPQIISQYAFFHPASLDLSLRSQKNISFGLLSFTAPTQLVRGHFALLVPPPPTNPSTEWKESASRLLCVFI